METSHFDAIVLGVGGFGSGALYHLARRGLKVLGLEQFSIAHDRGSSHGETRIIRQAYFEHPDYVPLLLRAYDLWDELADEADDTLMQRCGLLLCGPESGEAIHGARLSAIRYGIPVEDVSLAETAHRFPGFAVPEGYSVVFEPAAGFLHVEACVRAHILRAQARGADLKLGETVTGWSASSTGVSVRTAAGSYSANSLIITAGAWAAQLLAELSLPLTVIRKPVFWYPATGGMYDVRAGSPTFYYELPGGAFYGFPSIDGSTIKVAEHTGGAVVVDPRTVERDVTAADFGPVSAFSRQCLPGAVPEVVRHSVCLYTRTPDEHFIIDRHPENPRVVFGAGFSGHGFKFTSVLGQALAELAADGKTSLPVRFLSLDRPALRSATVKAAD